MTKEVKEGITILHNNATNCTFIASKLDEEVQTGTRENDGHIEWMGELDVKVCTKEYKQVEVSDEEIDVNLNDSIDFILRHYKGEDSLWLEFQLRMLCKQSTKSVEEQPKERGIKITNIDNPPSNSIESVEEFLESKSLRNDSLIWRDENNEDRTLSELLQSFTNTKRVSDEEIEEAAENQYVKYSSGYIDEQIQLERDRRSKINAFIDGAKWMRDNLK